MSEIEIPEGMQIQKLPVKKAKQVGRPRKYPTPKDLQKAVDDYFEWLEDYNETMRVIRRPEIAPTIGDLARSLGFAHRNRLHYIANLGEGFDHVIKSARLRIEAHMERVVSNNPAMALGWLKKNVPEEWGNPEGEGDGADVTVNGGGSVTINIQKNYGKVEE